jgi:hypothetical protein
VPGQPEVSRAALDRAHDLVGDVLVNIEAAGQRSQIPGAITVRERQFEVRDFLGVSLARFVDKCLIAKLQTLGIEVPATAD